MDTDNLIKAALKEDIGTGDITTEAIFKKDITVDAYITAKQDGIVSGLDIAEKAFKALDKDIAFEKLKKDTDRVKKGEDIAKITGSAKTILKAERTALNFLGHLSGIATYTNEFTRLCKNAQVLDTRKTTPLLRELEKYAVRCGGGKNHRRGLYDMMLIKDNHIKAAVGIKNALRLAKEIPGKKIEIECTTIEEVSDVLKDGSADIIMLDNMTTGEMKKAVKLIGRRAKTEASGGVNLSNIAEIDKTGVDYISVGAITSSAPRFDYSLKIRT
ncbi:MAG: carboxylating nicotinate-nucleotide diphosphorylase [archaeon]